MSICKVRLKNRIHYQAVQWMNGKRVRSKTFSSKSAALSWLHSNIVIEEPSASKLTVADAWERLESNLNISPKAKLDYRIIWSKHIEPYLGSKLIRDLKFADFENFRQYLMAKQLSNARVNRIHSRLSLILRYSIKLGCNETTLKHLPWEREELRARKVWRPDEAKAFLSHLQAQNSPWLFFYQFAYATGMRLSELTGLTWDCVNLSVGTVDVRQHFCEISSKILSTTKSGKMRTIFLSPKLLKACLVRSEVRCCDLVFCKDCKPIPYSSFRKSFIKLQQKANVTEINIHGIRHSFASNFLLAGGSLFVLKGILGHSDIKTTMRYSHLADSALKGAATIIDI